MSFEVRIDTRKLKGSPRFESNPAFKRIIVSYLLTGQSFTYLVDGANAEAEATAAMRTIARIILFDFVELNLEVYTKNSKAGCTSIPTPT